MITIIYGDDIEKIEKTIMDVSANKSVKRLIGQKISKKELEEELQGASLFGEETSFLIEGLFKNKNKKNLFSMISSAKDSDIILLERSRLTKRDLNALMFTTIYEHSLPQYYYKFLDEFVPGNGKNLAIVYKELLKSTTAEQVFYSLIKRVRALIAVKINATSHSEILRLAPWQMGKLKRQASFWKEQELILFYQRLYEVEYHMKSSKLPLSLEKYLDITVITELN